MKNDVMDTLYKLSVLNKEDLYLHHKDDLDLGKFSSNLSEIESNPFLGYVGKFYFDEQIRICFIGKSGAESRTVQSADLEMNEKFEKFRDSKYSERENAFDAYQNTICSHIEKWKVFKIPELLMEKTCTKNIHNISYVNIVPFRYKGAPSKTVYKIAWENFTQHFLQAIKPHFIIPLGKGFDKIITEYYSGNASVESGIRRTNGDTYIHEEAKKQIDLISSKIKNS